MNIIESIYRYPVKGFPGEALEEVELRENEGVPGDRRIALSSGTIPVNDSGAWTACQAFQRMSIRPDLTTFKIEGDRIYSKGHDNTLTDEYTDIGSIEDVFGDETTLQRSGNNRGYWDHKDSAISIINLNTVEAIAAAVGQEIDPLRFRGNLLIRAEPWSEFKLIGQEINFNGVTLNIIRPIDRCRATSADVKTGLLDINMPASLMRHFGHMFCGVYATVKKAGTIVAGDNFNVTRQISTKNMLDAAQQKTAPHTSQWPRSADVVSVKTEAEGISSFWIDDSLNLVGSLTRYQAGQYIRVHDLSQTHTWRSYTISEVKDDKLRITVKQDSGVGSQAIHQLQSNDKIIISGPFGDATINQKASAIHLISAGIGITPTVSKLNALFESEYKNPIIVTHVARSPSELVLWDDVLAIANKSSNVKTTLYLTKSDNVSDVVIGDVIYGRPNCEELAKESKNTLAEIHLCGPEGFVKSVAKALEDKGISDQKVFIDRFASPDVEIEMREIPSQSKPVKVTLSLSNITEYWQPEDGTLLDFVEAKGGLIPSHCRAGICKTCECKILSGTATRLVGEEGEDSTATLLCSSIPKQTLVLEA